MARRNRDDPRLLVSPAGIDILALQEAEQEFPQADVERFRVLSPEAARLALEQSSARPLSLTREEIELFEAQAARVESGRKGRRRASRDAISPDRII